MPFLVPREHRDEIYSYLLKHTKTGRTYHYHTNILAVNSTIGGEAEAYLYKNNHFAVVSYKWPSLHQPFPTLACVPMVAGKHVARMKHHCFRLYLERNAAWTNHPLSSAPISSILIHLGDLDQFCLALQVQLHLTAGPVVAVSDDHAEIYSRGLRTPHGPGVKPTSILMELRNSQYTTMTEQLQRQVLRPFHALASCAARVEIKGAVPDITSAEALKLSVGQSLVWESAMRWKLIETMRDVRDLADRLLQDGEADLALQIYTDIVDTLEFIILRHDSIMPNFGAPEANDTMRCSFLLTFDCQISALFTELKRADREAFVVRWYSFTHWLQAFCPDPAMLRDSAPHLALLIKHAAILGAIYEKDKGIQVKAAISELRKGGEALMAHDADILEACGDLEKEATAEDLPIKECAVYTMAPRVFDSLQVRSEPRKPANLVGYQDVADLPRLTGDQKHVINELQKKHSMPVTSFDTIQSR